MTTTMESPFVKSRQKLIEEVEGVSFDKKLIGVKCEQPFTVIFLLFCSFYSPKR